jgi:peroxiredoxin
MARGPTAPLPAPTDDGGARHLVAGVSLPDLALPSTTGELVNLRRRSGAVIVYVYPWTGRPGVPDPPGWDDIVGAHGSTPETEGFRDAYDQFAALGVDVFGLSMQASEHQRELSARLNLPFAILSDEQRRFQAELALPTFLAGDAAFLKRLTLYVCDGAIAHAFYPVHPPGTHAGKVLSWLGQFEPGA